MFSHASMEVINFWQEHIRNGVPCLQEMDHLRRSVIAVSHYTWCRFDPLFKAMSVSSLLLKTGIQKLRSGFEVCLSLFVYSHLGITRVRTQIPGYTGSGRRDIYDPEVSTMRMDRNKEGKDNA